MLDGLSVGDTLLRREVHERFGGRRQGGIGPSREAPVVLFFTDPATGHRHGYYDGWDDEGYFHYTGEGQVGDQRLVQGNKAIANHSTDGRSLEGFVADGTSVTYMGEFKLAEIYWTEAHESGSDALRQVAVFKLKPLADPGGLIPKAPYRVPVTPQTTARVDAVAVEEANTERAHVSPSREPYEIERRESMLVRSYAAYLRSRGQGTSRRRIVPPDELAPLYCDLWVDDLNELIEAKGGVNRDQVRHAVGQLFDYRRFLNPATCAVLVPERPRADLVSFLHSCGIEVIFPVGDAWQRLGA